MKMKLRFPKSMPGALHLVIAHEDLGKKALKILLSTSGNIKKSVGVWK